MSETPCLSDPDRFPDDPVLEECLGAAFKAWGRFQSLLAEQFPDLAGEWRYYRDGKSWLYKLARKSKTVCWCSVWSGEFKLTIYFPTSKRETILSGDVSPSLRERLGAAAASGKLLPVTFLVREVADTDVLPEALALKARYS